MKTKVKVPVVNPAGDVEVPDITAASVSPFAAASALFVSFALLMVGVGLQGAVVGVRIAGEASFTSLWTGLTMTAYFSGLLVGARLAVRSLGEVGHIRVFAALASMASTAALIHAVAVIPVVWVGMRFLTGVCAAGLYVVAESWLNDIATNANRGRLLAIYMVISMGGFAVGNLLLDTADPQTITLFVVSSVLVSMSLVPVALSTNSAPTIVLPEPMSWVEMMKIVPTGMTVGFLVGASHGAMLGMGSIFAARAGLDSGQIALFMGAPMIGTVITQFPLGLLSDRIPRRGLMMAIAIAAVAICGSLTMMEPGTYKVVGLMLLLGGMSFPLYSLTIAYTNDWLEQGQMMAASSTLVSVNGLGAMTGPFLVIGLGAVFGEMAYYWTMALTHGLIALYIGWRIAFRDAVPKDRQRRWVPLSMRSTLIANVVARPRRTRIGGERKKPRSRVSANQSRPRHTGQR